MGIPCVIVTEADAAKLLAAVEQDPAHDMTVDVDARTVTFNGLTIPVTLPDGARTQLLKGTWDATRILVDALPQVKETAAKLPYTRAFAS
jgi:3-isopropylmalate/(R)-2-methylmalate dehydratase small subunit